MPPFPGQWGMLGGCGGSLQGRTHSPHLWGRCGSSAQAAAWPGDRQARGSPASCSCSSLSPRASPGGSSAVGGPRRPQESRAKVCPVTPSRHSLASPIFFHLEPLDTLHSPQTPVRQPNPGPLPTAPRLLTSCAWPRQPRPRGTARREGGRGPEAIPEEGEEE